MRKMLASMHFKDINPQTTNCQSLAAAWHVWRGDKLVPHRADMRLEDITGILPFICLTDIISETEIIFRLAGTMVRETFGIELTGHNLLELTAAGHRAKRGARALQNALLPCGGLWIWDIAFAGQENRKTENLSLPVKPDDAGHPMQMLSVFGLLDSTSLPRSLDRLQQLASSEQHSFIDIGAGIPSED